MDETELYTLRWKGKLIGPLSLAMLQEKFLTGELSLAHEIQVGEQWLTLRNFLSTNPALVTMSSAAPAEETQTFTLRWRGKTMGPYTWAEISEKLSTGELSLAHEIQIGEQWLPLRSCASTDGRPPQAPVESQTPAPAAELPTYTVRWRGQRLGPYSWAEILKKLHAGEKFIGLGEKTGGLNRRGQFYQHWNSDVPAYALDARHGFHKASIARLTHREAAGN